MLTNFALLTDEQKTIWAKDLMKSARNYMFVNKFAGTSENSMIHRITELKKSEKGARAVITLLADLEGDGRAGDNTLENNEEPIKSYDQVIQIDQLRNANRHEGRMADQRSVVNFRGASKNVLAYWIADRCDQLAFLTLSGRSYGLHNNGAPRIGSDFPFLAYAADVAAPTSKRQLRWDKAAGDLIENGATSAVVATDTPTWALFVKLKAYAKTQYVRPLHGDSGEELYHAFLTPNAMAKLKLDPDYMANVRSAQKRSADNPLFTGAAIEIDGIAFHEYRHVYNTNGALAGSKWGAGGNVEGCQILFCGAQALGMADIGAPEWVEKGFDYDNQQGISIGKIMGFLKPKFNSIYAGNTVQDFGVISVYAAE